MELRPSEVHVPRIPGLVETIQQAKDAILEPSVDPTHPTFAPKFGQRFMLEGLYHLYTVVETTTSVNYSETPAIDSRRFSRPLSRHDT